MMEGLGGGGGGRGLEEMVDIGIFHWSNTSIQLCLLLLL